MVDADSSQIYSYSNSVHIKCIIASCLRKRSNTKFPVVFECVTVVGTFERGCTPAELSQTVYEEQKEKRTPTPYCYVKTR